MNRHTLTISRPFATPPPGTRMAFAALTLLLGSVCGLPPALAAAPVDMSLNPFLTLFPALKTAPAPAWLKPGRRWTYRYQYAGVYDPDGETPTSGSGLFQFDLVALTANRSAVSFKTYVEDVEGTKHFFIPTPAISSIQLPGLGQFWLAPVVLKNAESVANPDLSVTRWPKSDTNPTCPCVRFHSTREDNSAEYVWMFETATGRLLFYRHRIGQDGDPDHQTAQVRLSRQRTLPLPWLATKVRPWVKSATAWELDYSGYERIAYGNNDPSPVYLPYRAHLKRAQYQTPWAEYGVSDDLYTDQTGWVKKGSIRSVTGIAQLFDALWLPPEAGPAAGEWALNAWVTLDTDPVTKATLYGRRGSGNVITLCEVGLTTRFDLPIFQTCMRYRTTDGKLTQINRTDVVDVGWTFQSQSVLLDLQ